MRVVGISDIHGYLPKNLPSGDVLCICGDIVPLGYQNDLVESIAWFCLEFIPWCDSLKFKKIIIIGGNHDFFLQELLEKRHLLPDDVITKLLPGDNYSKHNIVLLHNNSYIYKGVKFYGTPYIKDLLNWAFYKNHDNLIKEFNNIPIDCDILLVHQPPKIGTVGVVLQEDRFNSGNNYGSQELADVILQKNIKWILCGHVHSGNHNITRAGSYHNIVNVSLKDESYKVKYEPFVFEI